MTPVTVGLTAPDCSYTQTHLKNWELGPLTAGTSCSSENCKTRLYLVHDGVLRVFGLDDGRLHKVPLLIITPPPSDDFQVGGRLGVIEPLLYPTKRLQEEQQEQIQR